MRKHRKLTVSRETLRNLEAVRGGIENTSAPSIGTTASLKIGCTQQCPPPPTAAETCGDSRPGSQFQV